MKIKPVSKPGLKMGITTSTTIAGLPIDIGIHDPGCKNCAIIKSCLRTQTTDSIMCGKGEWPVSVRGDGGFTISLNNTVDVSDEKDSNRLPSGNFQ